MSRNLFRSIVLLLLLPLTLEAATTIHVSNPATWKNSIMSAYVGKTVTFDCPMYISSGGGTTFQIGPRRVYTPSSIAIPGSAANIRVADLNQYATFSVSDVPMDNGKMRRLGTVIRNLTVTVNSTSSTKWESGDFVSGSRQDLIDEAAQGFPNLYDRKNDSINVMVCAMNCEYYLVAAYDGQYGPADDAAHQRQRAKISEALASIEADIYGLVEIQEGNGALSEIAADLTTHTGHPYTYVKSRTLQAGTFTQSGYVYRSDRVAPIGIVQKVTSAGTFAPRMAMIRFRVLSNGGEFIYSINHYKAKSSSDSYNSTRVNQANLTLSRYEELSRSWGESDILLMGDMNSYAMEDPILVFINAGMTDLHRHFHDSTSYSYVYHDGTAGYLDHAIANPTMLEQVKGMQAYHINSDENDSYTYNGKNSDETRFRCSDHDPVLVAMYVQPEASGEQQDLFDRLEATYFRVYNLTSGLVSEGQDEEMPTAPGIYIVVKYGTEPNNSQLHKVASRKYIIP